MTSVNWPRILPPVLLAGGGVAFGFYLISGLTRPSTPGVADFTGSDVSYMIAFAGFLPVGAFIAARRPDHPIGWIMCATGFFIGLSAGATEYATRAVLVDPGSLPAGREVSWFASWLTIPGFCLMTFLMLLFPTGRLLSNRWRWVARVAVANALIFLIAEASLWPYRGKALLVSPEDQVPEGVVVPIVVFEVLWIVLMLSAVIGFVSLVIRFRRSTGVERQQMKWVASAAAVVAVLAVLNLFVFDALGIPFSGFRVVTEHLLNLSVAGFSISVAIAILRYRLYDIDLIINRTLVYGALTAILVGVYVTVVFTLQRLLDPVTRDSDLAIAASTLAVAALFRPLRGRVQDFIDRRFYRSKFDAQRTLETFSARLRDEVDLSQLSTELVAVVRDTMQPAHVSLWLRTEPTET